MAWTTPDSYSVGEILAAAKLNTHLRDNLRYLKGLDGAVTIESPLTVSGATPALMLLSHTSGPYPSYQGIGSTGVGGWDINRNPASGSFGDTAKSHARIALDGSGATSFMQFLTANAANTAASERMRITGAGSVGIGVTAPQGPLHVFGALSGVIHYEFDGVDGTARTVLPNATGDVVYAYWAAWVIRASTGEVRSDSISGTGATPGSNITLQTLNAGADVCQLQVNANGAVTVQRTAGAKTYKVGLWMLWL